MVVDDYELHSCNWGLINYNKKIHHLLISVLITHLAATYKIYQLNDFHDSIEMLQFFSYKRSPILANGYIMFSFCSGIVANLLK